MCSAFSLDRFRQPEYTGENRCLPCTATNVVIAAVAGAAVALVWPPAGAGVLAVGLLAIYLRGYLVPGTPAFTRRYFPDAVLRAFDKTDPRPTAPASRSVADGAGADQPAETPGLTFLDDPESLLLAAGVLEPCPEVDDRCLTPAFRTAWRDRIEAVRTDADEQRALNALLHLDEGLPSNTTPRVSSRPTPTLSRSATGGPVRRSSPTSVPRSNSRRDTRTGAGSR